MGGCLSFPFLFFPLLSFPFPFLFFPFLSIPFPFLFFSDPLFLSFSRARAFLGESACADGCVRACACACPTLSELRSCAFGFRYFAWLGVSCCIPIRTHEVPCESLAGKSARCPLQERKSMEAPAPPVHADAPPPPTTTTAIPHLPTHTHHHYPTPPPRPPILSLTQPHATLPPGTHRLTTSSPPPPTHRHNPYHHACHPAHPPNPPPTHTHHAFLPPPPPPRPSPPGHPPTTRPHPAHTYAHTRVCAPPHARSDAYSSWGAGAHVDQERSSVKHKALWPNG